MYVCMQLVRKIRRRILTFELCTVQYVKKALFISMIIINRVIIICYIVEFFLINES